jgi:hypothetical protein
MARPTGFGAPRSTTMLDFRRMLKLRLLAKAKDHYLNRLRAALILPFCETCVIRQVERDF